MIIITGVSRGIGNYLFNKYLQKGEEVYGTYNRNKPAVANDKYISKVDVTDYQQVSRWVENIGSSSENVVLINCAGANYTSFAHNADLKNWIHVVNVNLIGTFYVIHAVLPFMREKGYGRIVNCASVVAQMPVPGTSAYASSKSGLWGLCKSIAVENARKGITINNLNLGYYNTGMIQEVPNEYQKLLKQKIPTGEFGNPSNIYHAINFLVKNDYINGSSIDINGCII